ncbi:MAG: aminotransferase class IV [Candidatus Hadarchaeota archaeon]
MAANQPTKKSEIIYQYGKPLEDVLPLRALFYAEGLFETFRWKNVPPALLKDHVTRMKRGAELLCIPFPGAEKIRKAAETAVKLSGIEDAYVKICLLSSGSLKFYDRASRSRLLIVVRKYEPTKERMTAHVTSFRRFSQSRLLSIKSLNYLENMLARREAKSAGCDEAIFLNEKGEVAEGSFTNIFWVKGRTLYTPSLECGLLPGITRGALLSLAPGLELKVVQGKFHLKEVLSSQGAFLTNSLIGISTITAVDKTKLPCDEKLFMKLKDALFKKMKWV